VAVAALARLVVTEAENDRSAGVVEEPDVTNGAVFRTSTAEKRSGQKDGRQGSRNSRHDPETGGGCQFESCCRTFRSAM
jgi:hypothetical protein